MQSVIRYDYGSMGAVQKSPQGYLKVSAYATRVGVFHYRMPDGTVRKELRPPEEVFDRNSLLTLAEVPITDDHPSEMLNPKNTKKYAVGFTGRDVEPIASFVQVKMTITEDGMIVKLENREKRETSCGYVCQLDETPGEWQGEAYDAVQRRIVYNHLAIVDQGRAGPSVRVHMDGAKDDVNVGVQVRNDDADREDAQWSPSFINNLPDEAFAFIEKGGEKDEDGKTVPRSLRHFPHHNANVKNGSDNSSVDLPHLRNALARAKQSPVGEKALPHLMAHAKALGVGEAGEDKNKQDKTEGGNVMVKITLDGIEYEASEGLAAKVREMEKSNTTLTAKVDELVKSADTSKGKIDALEADLKKKDDEIAKAKADKPSHEDIMKIAKDRLDLESYVKGVVGEDEFKKLDGEKADALVLKKAVIVKVTPEAKLDGKSDEYVSARFDHVRETCKTSDSVKTAIQQSAQAGRTDSVVDARKKMMEESKNSYQRGEQK